MGLFILPYDLDPFATIDEVKAVEMIADAEATAIAVAPCLVDEDGAVSATLTSNETAVVKSVLRSALLRWNQSGAGGVIQEGLGPFSHTIDNRSNKYGRFWPSEIEQLQTVCSKSQVGGVFSLSQISTTGTHLAWCALSLGANYCSCGVDIAGRPIYELP